MNRIEMLKVKAMFWYVYIHVRFITFDNNVEEVCLIKWCELSFISEISVPKLRLNWYCVFFCFLFSFYKAEAGVNTCTIPIKMKILHQLHVK